MSSLATTGAGDLAAATPRRLSPRAAFALQVSIAVFLLAGSSAPTPLYAVYQAQWGFSSITTTVVFGVYALAVLASLLTVGSISDHIGRRPVLLAALAAQAVTMVVFVTATGVPELMLARVIQGLSTGAALGAIGAGLLDLDRVRGTLANAVGPLTGTAIGGVGSGLLVAFLPVPTHLVYAVLLAVFGAQTIGVLLMRESAQRRSGAWRSLRPSFGLPRSARRPLLIAAPALAAAWALAGFYGSLGPALVRTLVGFSSPVLGGLALFVLAGSGAVVVVLTRNASARRVMLAGTAALTLGVGITVLGIAVGSAVLFFLGSAVAGGGFGGGFQGVLRTVVPLAEAHERAGLLSVIFVVSYLAMGLPAVIGGMLVVNGGGLATTAIRYAVAVMVLAGLAFAGMLATRPRVRAG